MKVITIKQPWATLIAKGCIIAKAKITDCIYVDDKFVREVVPKNPEVYKRLINKDNWDGYGFKIEDVEEIEPIQINGKLSLWDYDYKI